MLETWISSYYTDLAALLFNIAAFAAYRVVHGRSGRRDPTTTIQSEQAMVRAEWVGEILSSGNGILGVQTLRNAIMGSVFFASNTMFLVMGTLSLTAQKQLGETWARLNPVSASPSPGPVIQAKLLLLLLTLLVAFFCFLSAIRLFEHASVGIGLKVANPARVTAQINAAWSYQASGVRCYYFAAPILFWLFGPIWFVVAGLGAIMLMRTYDGMPLWRMSAER